MRDGLNRGGRRRRNMFVGGAGWADGWEFRYRVLGSETVQRLVVPRCSEDSRR